MMTCRICSNGIDNRLHVVREMMFGYHDEFEYFECGNCGCLQIKEIPVNLEKYYPAHYWHFETARIDDSKDGAWQSWLRRRRAKYWMSSKFDVLGKLISRGHAMPKHITWLRRVNNIRFDDAILDVGCGIGDRLLTLHKEGFCNLTGIDPFIAESISYPNGIKVYKKQVFELKGEFDFITLHHSFEHMPDQIAVIHKLFELLRPGKFALIRIPIASSYAWKEYGVNWVQLDAPRHFYLHTTESMRLLAEQAGFSIKQVVYDSNAFQFWGSEQYLKGISLYENCSYEVNAEESIFSPEQIHSFKLKARELNRNENGDQACFYLYKS